MSKVKGALHAIAFLEMPEGARRIAVVEIGFAEHEMQGHAVLAPMLP